MKKIMLLFLLPVLLCSLIVPAMATEAQLQIEDVTAKPEELIYLTLELSDSITADTVGVYFTFDTALLAMEEAQCAWTNRGLIQDFDAGRNAGVWTHSEAMEFRGQLCVAAFRVIAQEKELSTVISCRVLLKNGSDVAAELVRDVTVNVVCDHSYDPWENMDGQSHSRTCPLCGDTQLQPHQWDEGIAGAADICYTCTVCQAERMQNQSVDTVPATTQTEVQTAPQTDPTAAPTQPEEEPADGQGGFAWYWLLVIVALLTVILLLWRKKK